MEQILKILAELDQLIRTANRVVPIARAEDNNDWRRIEEVAGRLIGLSMSVKHSEQTLAVVKMAAPMHEHPARAVGRLGRALREKGIVFGE